MRSGSPGNDFMMGKMHGHESCYSGMVRSGGSIKKIHEIDISFASRFNITTRIDSVHCGIDDNRKYLTW